MWEFSNLNSGSSFRPPDSGQQQNTIVHPNSANSYCPSFCSVPFPGFTAQAGFLQFNSAIWPPPLNTPAPNFTIKPCSEPEATNTKKLLVFDHSGDRTSFVFSSVANPFEVLNPNLPAIHKYVASNSHIGEEDEIHEDTEEIDALLYSDSDDAYDDEEDSTGHSPLDVAEEEIAGSHLPAKRRRVDSAETDTASSTVAPFPHYIPEGCVNGVSFASCVGKGEDTAEQRGRSRRNKKERIRATVSMLRRMIPGGKGKGTAAVLDEAIQYLKLLKLQAKAVGAINLRREGEGNCH